ncbi:MAG: DUF4115 domain-containing protein [Alphaproteobacteria bacterium]|nr:DUF4115 domain-containing protein [Alphaproteobacteria bacterium]
MTSPNKPKRRRHTISTAPGGGASNYEDPAQEQAEEFHNSPQQPSLELDRIGDILKRVRERRGEYLENISDYLRIRVDYLSALENSKYDELPADAYVIGFLRTYANYLGLDGKVAIDQYRSEMAGRRHKPRLSMPQPISEGQTPSTAVLVGAIVAALLVYALWYSLSSSDQIAAAPTPALPQITEAEKTAATTVAAVVPAPVEIKAQEIAPAAQTPAPTTQTAPAATTTTTPAPTTAAPVQNTAPTVKAAETPSAPASATETATSNENRIVIRAEKESWVLIVDAKGSTMLDRIFRQGETYNVPNQKGLKLTTGNGGGIIISLDGNDLPPLGNNAKVVRGIVLDPETLEKQLPPQ